MDKLAQVVRDVVRLQHIYRQSHQVNSLHVGVVFENLLSDKQSDLLDAEIDSWVFEDEVGQSQGQLQVAARHLTEDRVVLQIVQTVLKLLGRFLREFVLRDSEEAIHNGLFDCKERRVGTLVEQVAQEELAAETGRFQVQQTLV